MDTYERMKHYGRVADQADLLKRAADVARRNESRRSAHQGVRRIIRVRLRGGSLPFEGIPATISGRPGDNSPCGVCDHDVTNRQLMMLVTHVAFSRSIPFHVDCYELWNDERREYKADLTNSARPFGGVPVVTRLGDPPRA
jgi:hypothetical protein